MADNRSLDERELRRIRREQIRKEEKQERLLQTLHRQIEEKREKHKDYVQTNRKPDNPTDQDQGLPWSKEYLEDDYESEHRLISSTPFDKRDVGAPLASKISAAANREADKSNPKAETFEERMSRISKELESLREIGEDKHVYEEGKLRKERMPGISNREDSDRKDSRSHMDYIDSEERINARIARPGSKLANSIYHPADYKDDEYEDQEYADELDSDATRTLDEQKFGNFLKTVKRSN